MPGLLAGLLLHSVVKSVVRIVWAVSAVSVVRIVWVTITGSPSEGIVVTPRTPIIERIAVWIGLVMTIIEVSIVVIMRIDPVIPLRVGKRNARQQRKNCEHVFHAAFSFLLERNCSVLACRRRTSVGNIRAILLIN